MKALVTILSASFCSASLVFPSYAYSQESNEADPALSQELSNCDRFSEEEKEKCKEFVAELLKEPAELVRPDFLVPDSPVFSVLDVKPENIVNPASPRSLAFSLLNGTDAKGNIQTGLAIDTAPYLYTDVSLGEYRNNYFNRLLSNTQVSVGTSKGGSDADESARLAVGLRVTLFDYGDPRMSEVLDESFTAAFERLSSTDKEIDDISDKKLEWTRLKRGIEGAADDTAIKEVLSSKIDDLDAELIEAVRQAASDDQLDVISNKRIVLATFMVMAEKEEGRTKIIEAIDGRIRNADAEVASLGDDGERRKAATKLWKDEVAKYNKGTWNATSLTIGGAPVFFSETGSYGDLKADGYSVYATFSYGFDGFKRTTPENKDSRGWLARNAQILFHARYTDKQREALDDAGLFRTQDTAVYGGQFRLKGPQLWSDDGDDLVFSLEGSIIDKDFDLGGGDTITRYSAAIELKPIKNSGLTLKGVVGGESGGNDNDSAFAAVSVNYAL